MRAQPCEPPQSGEQLLLRASGGRDVRSKRWDLWPGEAGLWWLAPKRCGRLADMSAVLAAAGGRHDSDTIR
jgi:hypothetical protein